MFFASILSATLSGGGIAGIAIAAVVFITVLALVIRTICNKPSAEIVEKVTFDDVDNQKAVTHLQEAVRIKTVSMIDDYVDNVEPFLQYRSWLEKSYPLIHQNADLTIIADYSLVYHIKGQNPNLKGGCFLSHIDVVPAPIDGWDYDPFSGHLTEDGYIYGRGTQDMKGHMIALLEALEYHLSKGTKFERDIYLCFGHDEEPGQSLNGAPSIVAYLKQKGVELEFVIDEGGATLDGKMLGIPKTVALIGSAEKGNGDLEVVVKKAGGHASNPKYPTADGVLADCIRKIEKKPMKTHWTTLSKEMIATLSAETKGIFKFFFTNRDVFSPLLKWVFSIVTPMTNALVRSTFAPTVLKGSNATNVIPTEASVNINYRILTGQTADDVKAHLEKILKKEIKKGWVEIKMLHYSNPSPEADVKCNAYAQIKKSIDQTFDGIVVAPYPFIAASDARFYNPLTNNVFRFGPFVYGLEDQARIHGINERLHVDQLSTAVQFFANCLVNTCCK